jgi:hypothetical protein
MHNTLPTIYVFLEVQAMNRSCKIVLTTLSLFIISTSVLAGDYRKSSGLSLSYGNHGSHQNSRLGYISNHKKYSDNYSKHKKRHSYSHKPYSYPKYWRQPRYGHRSFGYGYNSYSYHQPSYYQKHHGQQICQPVTKVVVDKHGKYHGVDATLCYDNYDESSGSRYLKR